MFQIESKSLNLKKCKIDWTAISVASFRWSLTLYFNHLYNRSNRFTLTTVFFILQKKIHFFLVTYLCHFNFCFSESCPFCQQGKLNLKLVTTSNGCSLWPPTILSPLLPLSLLCSLNIVLKTGFFSLQLLTTDLYCY